MRMSVCATVANRVIMHISQTCHYFIIIVIPISYSFKCSLIKSNCEDFGSSFRVTELVVGWSCSFTTKASLIIILIKLVWKHANKLIVDFYIEYFH